MNGKKPTTEDVAQYIAVNARRVKGLRFLTDIEVARRMGCKRAFVTRILQAAFPSLTVPVLLRLANALDVTLAELVSRPDDMSLLKQDGRVTRWETGRKKQKLQQTQEQAEMQALMESLGLDDG